MDCSPQASSVHGILQARILEWVAISFSRECCRPRGGTRSLTSPAVAGRFFTTSAIWEVPCGLNFPPPGPSVSASLPQICMVSGTCHFLEQTARRGEPGNCGHLPARLSALPLTPVLSSDLLRDVRASNQAACHSRTWQGK